MSKSYNKGEWSELYAFARLLKEGKMYAADENVNMIEDIYFPILKILRTESSEDRFAYEPGQVIKIFKNDELIDEIDVETIEENAKLLFEKIFEGGETSGSFEINEMEDFLKTMHITKIKAASSEKVDMTLQIHDINTGFSPIVGFSVKSDVGSPPTLLNAGKNTRISYEIIGVTDNDMHAINAIDRSVSREYMKERMAELLKRSDKIVFSKVKDQVFEDNLIMIDSMLPVIFGEMVLLHYNIISTGTYECELLIDLLSDFNPLGYRQRNVYRYKFKKMLAAAALGMTAGKEWDGYETATGGYIIIKRDGNVLCYHLYNRDYFEEYLMRNTQFDRPSASRHDYGYVYREGDQYYIDLNVQIRFKSIKSANEIDSFKRDEKAAKVREYVKIIYDENEIEL